MPRFILSARASMQLLLTASLRSSIAGGAELCEKHQPPTPGPCVEDLLASARVSLSSGFAPSFSAGELRDVCHDLGITALGVAVAKRSLRRCQASYDMQLVSPVLLERGLLQVLPGVYALSPEACLLHQCGRLTLLQAIQLGYELCGKYVLSSSLAGGFGKRAPLLEPQSLAGFCEEAAGLHGIRVLKQASEYLLAGSESPRETRLAMQTTLPRFLGGHNIRDVALNAPVELSPAARRACGRKTLRCDLLIGNLDVEYDSDRHHLGARAHGSDSRRTAALGIMGIEVLPVASGQLDSLLQFDGVVNSIRKHFGMKPFRDSRSFAAKRNQLLDETMYRSDWPI